MARLEAALLVTERPLSVRKLVQYAMLADAADVRSHVELLNAAYDRDESPFRVERVGAGFQLLTLPQFAPWLDKLHQRQSRLKLSPAALETLTIVAYRQPLTRADVEAVRGVQSAEMLKLLMERGLVRIAGEDDSLGRPYLYGTTPLFLELFGLQSLDDLPNDDLRRPSDASAASQDAADGGSTDPDRPEAPSGCEEFEDADDVSDVSAAVA